MQGIDSPERVTAQLDCLVKEGVEFVIRYISPNTKNFPTKRLTAGEGKAISKAGLLVASVWESLPLDDKKKAAYFNRTKGVRDGKWAYAYAKDTLGQPKGAAIYFGVDYDAGNAENKGSITEYFRGILEGFKAIDSMPLYQIGVYGSGDTCSLLLKQGDVNHGWLALSPKWGGFNSFKNWSIKQIAEKKVCKLNADTNTSVTEFGQYRLV